MIVRTSLSHPLEIASVRPQPDFGLLGLSLCPGKTQSNAMTGRWDRDLAVDLDAIAAWGASAILTLVEPSELEALGVGDLGLQCRARHMHWYHLPIRDRSIPDLHFEQAWAEVGEALRARLRAGSGVFVHCMGGLGRAGTMAARLLVELGWEPRSAIAKVRKVRPGALETAAQEGHVLTISAMVEPTPDSSPEGLLDRATGALLGLACGDAVGTTLEFKRRDSYPCLEDMIGGGPFGLSAGEWTDDTAMALALADSLLAKGMLVEADLMARFTDWYEHGTYSCTGKCFDIGVTTRLALMRWKRDGNAIAGSTEPSSAGNGSLMRLAPIAIRFWNDLPRLRDTAARQSRTTHAAAEAVDACVAFAEILAQAIAGQPRSAVLRPQQSILSGQIATIMAGSWRGKGRGAIKSSGYVAHSLEAAFWSVGRSGNFAEAVLTAANLGDDADTVAAITGQLAGALAGARSLPQAWRDRLAWGPRISSMASALLADSGLRPD